jgi:hypothetical protein
MRKIGVALVVVLAIVTFYKLRYPTYVYRYRLTVEVDAGTEVRSGSSVIQVTVSNQPQFLPEVPPYEHSVRGQAVFVELPGGKNLVALLASGANAEYPDYPNVIVERLFRVPFENLPSLTGRRELSANQMPTLVTVDNPNDGKTARALNATALEDLLGVRLRSIVLEMTTDSVTPIDIDSRLPFLVNEAKKRVEYSFPRYSSFIRR